MSFAGFVGNARVVRVLERMLEADRLPHALLFAGQKGVGKFTLAALFARALNCERKQGEICGACGSCRALAALDDLEGMKSVALKERGSANPEAVPLLLRPHPSVTVLVPDGAYIRVSQMRAVVRQAYLQPAGVRRNVFLIDEAERLRFDYADVLLKVLEEPPERTTLILVTPAPFELRATLRSRCIPLFFAPLSTADIEHHLASHRRDWKAAERQLAAAAAAGSLGTARALDLDHYRQVRAEALELVRAAITRRFNPERLFAASAALAGKGGPTELDSGERREALEFSLDLLYSLLSDVLYLKIGTPELGLRHPDLRSELHGLSRQVGREWLTRAVGTLDRIEGWQRRNINRQLALEAWALGPADLFSPAG